MKKPQVVKSKPASIRATYQDVLDAPPHMVAEIIDGTLYTHPRPRVSNAIASTGLGGFISQTFQYGRDGPGGWWILFEPELNVGDDVVVPDIAGWRRKRMPELPTGAYITLAPDWVCEVLSPSTRTFDLGGKRAVYNRERVSYLWLVDPDARSLEAMALLNTEWVLIDTLFDEALVSLPPFEATSFNLSDLWPPHAVHKDLPPQEEQPSKLKVESEPGIAETSK